MKRLARITGTIFLVVGVIAIVLGAVEMLRAVARPEPFMPSLFGSQEAEGMLLPLRLIVGWIAVIQGLLLAALGEGLWLVANIAQESQSSRELLKKLVGQGQLGIP